MIQDKNQIRILIFISRVISGVDLLMNSELNNYLDPIKCIQLMITSNAMSGQKIVKRQTTAGKIKSFLNQWL
jgi:hypothetical protein